jgi:hypothetical protein
MKNILKIILLLFCVSSGFASTITPLNRTLDVEDGYTKVSKIISKILNEVDFEGQINNDFSVEIVLYVSKENKINIINVSSHSNDIKRAVKALLNGKKIDIGDLSFNVEYTFPIVVKYEN